MGFLDRCPFDAAGSDGRALLAALLAAYDQAPVVREFVLAAGLRPAEFSWVAPMSQVWPEVLRKAADQGRLRRLVTAVAGDPGSAAYEVIARLAAEPAEEGTPTALREQEPAEDARHGSDVHAAGPRPVRLAPQPAYLAGREEVLQALRERLGPTAPSTPNVVVLSGLGGIGKTALALGYAHRHLDDYGLAWQFQSGDPISLTNQYAELAVYLGVEQLTDNRSAVQEVHNRLAAQARRWLLLFDDAPDRAALRDFLPPAGKGEILITTRNSNWPTVQVIRVSLLEHAAAAEFLLDRTSDGNQEAASNVAKMLGRLPLALEQAGAYTVAAGCGLKGYADLFRAHQRELLARGLPTDYDQTVATTWLVAFNHLNRTAPASITLLRLLACLASYPLPLSLLLIPASALPTGMDHEVAESVQELLASELNIDEAVAALGLYSLVSPAGNRTVNVHPLVKSVTLDQISPDRLPGWRHAAAVLLKSVLPDDPEHPETWPIYQALTPHALAALPASDMQGVADFLRHSGNYATALVVQKHIAEDVLERLGEQHIESWAAMAGVFYCEGETGRPEGARDGFTGLLNGLEDALEPEDEFILQLRAQVARWTGEAGDPASACALYEELLPQLERILGELNEVTQRAKFNYAAFLSEADQPAKAKSIYESVLPVYEEMFGPNHLRTLDVRANLAVATGSAGEPARARDLYAALIPVMEQALGAAHPNVLTDRANMALMTAQAGDLVTALRELKEILPVIERVRGSESRHVTRVKELIEKFSSGSD